MTTAPHTPGEPRGEGGRPGPSRRFLRAAAAEVSDHFRRNAARGRDALRRAWRRRPDGTRTLAIVFAALLVATGLHGIRFRATLPSRLPAPLDWRALGALLERDARAGDAVALSPEWAERARVVAPARVPVLAAATYEGEDLAGVRRLWLVSLPRAPGFNYDVEVDLLGRASRNDVPLELGGLEVTRYDVGAPVAPLAFLPDRLAAAEVRLGAGVCDPEGAGFRCAIPAAARPTLLVERTVREVGGLPRPCLLASPDAAAGAPLSLAFPDVPVGRVVRGHAGLAGDPPGVRTPVRIAVLVDGEEAGAAELSAPGWSAFQIDTSRFAGRSRTLSLVLTTTGRPGPLCLDAVTLP